VYLTPLGCVILLVVENIKNFLMGKVFLALPTRLDLHYRFKLTRHSRVMDELTPVVVRTKKSKAQR
jgi:hypothetical protein